MQIRKYKLILFLVDALIIIYSLKYSFKYVNYLRGVDYYPPIDFFVFAVLVFLITIIFKISNLYKIQVIFDSYYQFVVIFKAILIGYGFLIASLFVMKHPLLFIRREIVVSVLAVFVLLFSWRILIFRPFLRYLLKHKKVGSRVILIGAGTKGQEIVKELISNTYAYFRPIGFLDDIKEVGYSVQGIKVLDVISNIDKYTDKFDEVLIALTDVSYNRLQEIINTCRKLKKPIHVISDLYRIISEKLEVERFDGFSTFYIPPITGLKEYIYIFFKRLIDYSVAISIIVLFLPFWLIIAILIKIGSPGPVLYKTTVIGYREKEFVWYKFRSMYHNSDDQIHRNLVKEIAEGKRGGQKLQNDPRITPIGRWLRKYSIDEFPQLINVLKGQMSLVGPRPVLPYEYELLDDWQKERFTVLPGMTGLWQVRGRNKVNFNDQYVLDIYYVRNRSVALDMEILFSTISIVLSGKTGI